MSGDIYFGFDCTKPVGHRRNDGYVNTPTFMAFGDLITAALSIELPTQLEIIKEREMMAVYEFESLTASDYNAVIRRIRQYIVSLQNPTDEQKIGIWVWQEMAEPFIHKDERYDAEFHKNGT